MSDIEQLSLTCRCGNRIELRDADTNVTCECGRSYAVTVTELGGHADDEEADSG